MELKQTFLHLELRFLFLLSFPPGTCLSKSRVCRPSGNLHLTRVHTNQGFIGILLEQTLDVMRVSV